MSNVAHSSTLGKGGQVELALGNVLMSWLAQKVLLPGEICSAVGVRAKPTESI